MYIYGLKICYLSVYFPSNTTNSFFIGQYNASLYWSVFIFLLLFINQESILADIFNTKFLKTFGLYSFGMYLLHFESYVIVAYLSKKDIIGKTTINFITIEFFAIYIFGAIFFRLIENPSMNLGNKLIKLVKL